MKNLVNIEIINISTKNGKLVALISYHEVNVGSNTIEVPINLRDIPLKSKFRVEWIQNVISGIGKSGTEYFSAENREDALKQFWNGKNKKTIIVNSICVC